MLQSMAAAPNANPVPINKRGERLSFISSVCQLVVVVVVVVDLATIYLLSSMLMNNNKYY